jgi:hypothetical protein
MEMPLLTEKPDRGFLETPNAADLLEEFKAGQNTSKETRLSVPRRRLEGGTGSLSAGSVALSAAR